MADDVVIRFNVHNKQAISALQSFTREINKTTNKVDEDINKMKKSAGKFSIITRAIKSYWGEMATAAGVVYGLVRAVKSLTDAYNKQEEADRKLHQVLVSTGNYTPEYENHLKRLASQYQKTTMYGDEMVENAEAIMLTFTKVGDDVFPQAIESAMDMSTMFGQDLKQSVIQLGTALNDPIQGIGRLRRIGISFTETQKEMIKNFMEQGEVAKAQRVILDELKKEIGGTAKAMGETYAGSVAKLKNAIGDLKETIGGLIANALNPLIPLMIKIVNKINDWIKAKKRLKQAYDDVKKSIREVTDLERSEYLQSKILIAQKEVEIAKRRLMAGHRTMAARQLKKEYEQRLKELNSLKRVKEVWDNYINSVKESTEETKENITQTKEVTEVTKGYSESMVISGWRLQVMLDAFEQRHQKSIEYVSDLKTEYTWNDHINKVLLEGEKRYKALHKATKDATKSTKDVTNETKKQGHTMVDTAKKVDGLIWAEELLQDIQEQLAEFMKSTFKDAFASSWEEIWLQTGDTSKKIKKAVKDLFVALLRAVGKQLAIASAGYLLTLQFGKAAAAATLSAAAFAAAQYISRLQQGGIIKAQQGYYGGGDTNLVLTEPGEMVVRKEVVREHYAELQALNSGQSTPINLSIYIGGKLLYNNITHAIENGQIVIDRRAIR